MLNPLADDFQAFLCAKIMTKVPLLKHEMPLKHHNEDLTVLLEDQEQIVHVSNFQCFLQTQGQPSSAESLPNIVIQQTSLHVLQW